MVLDFLGDADAHGDAPDANGLSAAPNSTVVEAKFLAMAAVGLMTPPADAGSASNLVNKWQRLAAPCQTRLQSGHQVARRQRGTPLMPRRVALEFCQPGDLAAA
jgi:hypothetical protein